MRTIDGHKTADEAHFNGSHCLVLLWCGLIIVLDGYDLAVGGITLPSVMKELNVAPTQAGFMVSAALFGMMFGAITLGTVADRIGRRKAIAICIALFSIFTVAADLAKDPLTFSAMRFLAGLGIGGAMPNVIAHMTEHAPKRIRAMMVTLMFSAYSVGSMLAAVVVKGLIESQPMSTAWLYLLVGLAGASTIGTQLVNSAYAGQCCPALLRSTGIGWALGVGRGGAILAPILIGCLVSLALPLQQNFISIAIPAGIAAMAIAFVNHRHPDAEQSRAQSNAAAGLSLKAVPLKRA